MLRSYLYVPGDQPARLEKAIGLTGDRRPDALIIDLEDAVAASHKLAARTAAAALTGGKSHTVGPALFVRINAGDFDDLRAIIGPSLAGVVVPKATSISVGEVASVLQQAGSNAQILPLVETALGISTISNIAAIGGVTSLAIGEADLGSELGIAAQASWAWWPIRMNLVVASAAANLDAPTGPVSTEFRDLTEFEQSTTALLHAGFGSRPAIHPDQLPIINQIMKPSVADMDNARRLVERYDTALASGVGAVTDEHGRMVDEAIVRRARMLLNGAIHPQTS